MPPPNIKDASTTSNRGTGSSTNKSPRDGTESPKSRVSSAKRLDDPQKGHDGKHRCEHDGKCPESFTTETGLVRHEREVHGKHGGPKETLFCTVSECPRNSGEPFKRKENLSEHCRRAHGGNPQLQKIARATIELVNPASQFDFESEIKQLKAESSAMNDRISRLERSDDLKEKRLAKAEEMLAGKLMALEEKVSARSIVGGL
jgi:uncharacterized Zn-finger protein